jgi:hypothetical protein
MAAAALFVCAVLGSFVAIAQLQLRHLALAALVVAGPLLALAALDAAAPAFLTDDGDGEIFAALFALACGQLIAHRAVRGLCEGAAPGAAMRQAAKRIFWVAGPVAAASFLPTMARLTGSQAFDAFAAHGAIVLAALLGMAAALAAATFLPYTEDFVVRANAARERRQRRLAPLNLFAEPRWSFSLSGIALVLATLAGFAIRGADLPETWPYLPLAAIFWAAALALVTRNWRLSVALTLAAVLAAAYAIAAFSYSSFAWGEIGRFALSCAIGIVPAAVLGAGWSGFLRDGDDVATAWDRALRDEGPGVLFALLPPVALAATFGVLVSAGGRSPLTPLAVAAFGFPFAAFFVFPAFAVALYTLLPPRVSLEEALRRK